MTKQDNAHAELPWSVEQEARYGVIKWVRSSQNGVPDVNRLFCTKQGDAAFIVEACNSFYDRKALISELVELLDTAESFVLEHGSLSADLLVKEIRAALSKAKEAAQ